MELEIVPYLRMSIQCLLHESALWNATCIVQFLHPKTPPLTLPSDHFSALLLSMRAHRVTVWKKLKPWFGFDVGLILTSYAEDSDFEEDNAGESSGIVVDEVIENKDNNESPMVQVPQ
ncbi:hypothetical protein RYX36_010429 [Vicia faba]